MRACVCVCVCTCVCVVHTCIPTIYHSVHVCSYIYLDIHTYTLHSFAALFSPAKRREMEKSFDNTPRRSIMSRNSPSGTSEADGGNIHPHAVGYRNTNVIPVLRKTGRRQGTWVFVKFGACRVCECVGCVGVSVWNV